MTKEKQKGFTLVEILLVVTIISIITVIALASWSSFSDTAALGNNAKMIEAKIKLAKSYSLSALNDVNYGVHLEAGNITIYPANAAYVLGGPSNQVFALTDGVEIYDGIGNNIVFSRLTGTTADSGAIGIRVINRPSKTKTVTINSQGQTGIDVFQTSSISPINNARHVHFNLGWNIQNATFLKLAWVDNISGVSIITTSVDTTSYFNADKTAFDWTGTTLVNGVSQRLRVHSWLDSSSNTVLCVMRDATENEKLNIYFTDGGDKKTVTYEKNDATGAVTVTADVVYGGIMEIQ